MAGGAAAAERDPMARVEALLRAVAASAGRTERLGRLAEADALLAAGLFRLLLPRSVGGGEADPLTFLRVVEALGGADASTGWCVAQTSVCGMAAQRLAPDAARAVFGEPAAVLAWGHGPAGSAVPCPGGWRVSGAWSFGSGMHHATWLGGACAVEGAAGPMRMMLFPRGAAACTPEWEVIGLRGTGSDGYSVTDAFVAEALSFRFSDPAGAHAPGALHRLPPDSLWAAGFAGVALGVAAAMREDLVVLARGKTARGMAGVLAEAPSVQALVAGTDAALRAARLLLHAAVEAAHAQAAALGRVDLAGRVDVRLAASHALREARAAVEALYHAAGAAAVFAANPFERRLRDMHAIGQHVHGRQQHFESAGRFMLGGLGDEIPAFL